MSSGDLLARAMETPAHHEAAMQVLYANPGMTYDRACEIAQGQPRPEAPRSAQHARQPVTSYDPSRAMEAPPYHNAAMTYMLAHPGMMYSEAVAHVTGGK